MATMTPAERTASLGGKGSTARRRHLMIQCKPGHQRQRKHDGRVSARARASTSRVP